jgi:DNA helicase IV
MSELSAEIRAIVDEEEALLARVRAALEAARQRGPRTETHAVEVQRSLRDQAMEARQEDLPSLLHEMSVRQRLAEQAAPARLPDARAPYVAHLKLREDGQVKDYLLGHTTFFDASAGVRIVDWRVAPVAQIFYRYREGDDYEEAFPGRTAEGVVEARRILVFEAGALARILGDHLVVAREAGTWRVGDAWALASGGAGSAARPGVLGVGVGVEGRSRADVTALLDADQFAAISAPAEKPLVVLGSAGSGKTTVALHRLARIAAAEPDRHPLAHMRVVVPEEGLARLSRRLLAPLGAGEAQVKTLDAWAADLAQRIFGEPLKLSSDAPASVIGLKRHRALYHSLREHVPSSTRLAQLRLRLGTLLSDRAFLAAVVDQSQGELPRAAIEDTVRHTMLQLADPLDRQLRSITDAERKQAIDGRSLAEGTPDALAGTVDVEDLPILLCLRAWQGELGLRPLSHLVLDEAEDFSLFELFVLGRQLGELRSVTLAGDEAQQTESSFAGWQESVATLGVGHAPTVRLAVSYRCPRPVAELAHRILGAMAPDSPARAAREGAPLGRFRFPSEAQAQLFLLGALRDLLDREPGASVGVIAQDAESAQRFHRGLAELPETRLVLHGEFTFEPGIDVTDVDHAKGLEWDYVIVPDATRDAYPATPDARRRLHVAVTRTSHQLWLVTGGLPSPLLD